MTPRRVVVVEAFGRHVVGDVLSSPSKVPAEHADRVRPVEPGEVLLRARVDDRAMVDGREVAVREGRLYVATHPLAGRPTRRSRFDEVTTA